MEARGRAVTYVLALAGHEDILKVGHCGDLLARWSAFHPRWFEAFDLERSAVVHCETRADARRLEHSLHRRLALHRCPVPMTMRGWAGGATEWFRGAHGDAMGFVEEQASAGFMVESGVRGHLARSLKLQRQGLFSLVEQAARDEAVGAFSDAQRAALRDLLDAHRAFGADLDGIELPLAGERM